MNEKQRLAEEIVNYVNLVGNKNPHIQEVARKLFDLVKEHRSTNCKYCESRIGGAGPLIHDPKTISFFEIDEVDESGGVLELSGSRGEATWKINYCPMCGKKLFRDRTTVDDILNELNSDGEENPFSEAIELGGMGIDDFERRKREEQ